MLNVVYGKARSGKTTYMYNQIKNKYDINIEKDVQTYLIVPEQFNLSIEEKLSKFLNVGGLFNIEVLTFKRMAQRIINTLNIKLDKITDVGKKIIIYDILSNNSYTIFNSLNKGNVEKILDIFDEFAKYNVNVEELSTTDFHDTFLNIKIKELCDIYIKFLSVVLSNSLSIKSDLNILNENVLDSRLCNCDIYVDEFFGYTDEEIEIICKLSKNNNVTISFCIDGINVGENAFDVYNSNKQEYLNFISYCNKYNIEVNSSICMENPVNRQDEAITHLCNNIFCYPYKNYERVCDNVEIFSCINPYVEAENLAINILKDIKNGASFDSIAVITKDIDKYKTYISLVLEKYNIPYFLDSKINISTNQISQLILSIIDNIISNFSYETVFAYLKTGFLDIDIDDIFLLENYALQWGIKGYKWEGKFNYGDDAELNEKINTIKEQTIEPLIQLKKAVLKQNNAHDIIFLLYKFLEENEIKKHIDNRIKQFHDLGLLTIEKEYTDIWNYYIEIFKQLDITLGDRKNNITEFKNLLDLGINNTQRAFIPLYKNCVIIGDVGRTRINNIDNIYFIGVQNDKFPLSFTSEGLLNDDERIILNNSNFKLAKTTKQKTIDDQFNIYKVLTMTNKKATFSYIFNDLEGQNYRPSIMINRIKKLFDIQEKIVDNEYIFSNDLIIKKSIFDHVFSNDLGLMKWCINNDADTFQKYLEICNYEINYNIKLSDDNVKKLYGDTLKGSVSKLEEYAKCPYNFYLKYGLNVLQRQLYEIKTLDIGNLNHQILDEFFKYLIDNNVEYSNMTHEECDKLSSKIIDEVFNNLKIFAIKESLKFNVLKIRLKQILQQSIWVLVLQIRNSSFRPIGTEVEFNDDKKYHKIVIELDNNKKVELKGKIDRIDIADTKDGQYIRVIDYKSSSRNLDVEDIYSGINLQLITYLDVVTEQENQLIPGGLFYFKIDNPVIKTNGDISKDELESKLINELRLKGLILNDKTLISHMDNNITSSSNLVNIKINKDGECTSKSAINLDEFQKLQKDAKKVIKELSNKIMSGYINVKPYWKSKQLNGCQYCQYSSICKH